MEADIDADPTASSAVFQLSAERMRQVMLVTIMSLLASAALSMANAAINPELGHAPLYVSLLGAVAVATLYLRARSLQDACAAQPVQGSFIMVLSITLCGMVWVGRGIYDVTILSMPVLITVAATTLSRRRFRAVLLIVMGSTTAMFVSNWTGLTHHTPMPWTVVDAYMAILILAASAGVTAQLARDVRHNLVKLQHSSRQVDEATNAAHRAAHHDALTGLPNRNMAILVGEELLRHAERDKAMLSAMVISRQDLAMINETMGHDAGDELIARTATHLLKGAGEHFVARLGGNEFLVLVRHPNARQYIEEVAQSILAAMELYVDVHGMEIPGSSAGGIASYPQDANNLPELLRLATRACKEAVAAGGVTYRYFNEDMQLRNVSHVRLMADLRAAIRNGGREFWLAYQPKINLDSGRLMGLEALLRWKHERLGPINTEEFINLAEQHGLIVELGTWVLNKACQDAAAWTSGALRNASLAVNVSALQFRRDDIVATVKRALQSSGLHPHRLVLEVTESLFVADAHEIRAAIAALHALGVSIAIDDFGTGYSNLGYLQRFDIDSIKVDRSFVRNIDTDEKNAALVRAIVGMGRALNMEVVAEGVETQEVAALLLKMGCHTGQGYLWSEPVRSELLVERWDLPLVQQERLAARRGKPQLKVVSPPAAPPFKSSAAPTSIAATGTSDQGPPEEAPDDCQP